MVRNLLEPRNKLAEPLGSVQPRLNNTGVDYMIVIIQLVK